MFIIDSCLKPEIQKNFLSSFGSLTNESLKDSFLSSDFLNENCKIYNFMNKFGVLIDKNFIEEIFKFTLTIKDKIDLSLVFDLTVNDILNQCKNHSNKTRYSKEFRLNFEEEVKKYVLEKTIFLSDKERKFKL